MADKVQLSIELGNAAFEDGPVEFEVARILRDLADKLESNGLDGEFSVRDINGNTVGQFTTS